MRVSRVSRSPYEPAFVADDGDDPISLEELGRAWMRLERRAALAPSPFASLPPVDVLDHRLALGDPEAEPSFDPREREAA